MKKNEPFMKIDGTFIDTETSLDDLIDEDGKIKPVAPTPKSKRRLAFEKAMLEALKEAESAAAVTTTAGTSTTVPPTTVAAIEAELAKMRRGQEADRIRDEALQAEIERQKATREQADRPNPDNIEANSW